MDVKGKILLIQEVNYYIDLLNLYLLHLIFILIIIIFYHLINYML